MKYPRDWPGFRYDGGLYEFAGVVDDWWEGECVYLYPLDSALTRPDLPGYIFHHLEIEPLTPAACLVALQFCHPRVIELMTEDKP